MEDKTEVEGDSHSLPSDTVFCRMKERMKMRRWGINVKKMSQKRGRWGFLRVKKETKKKRVEREGKRVFRLSSARVNPSIVKVKG